MNILWYIQKSYFFDFFKKQTADSGKTNYYNLYKNQFQIFYLKNTLKKYRMYFLPH